MKLFTANRLEALFDALAANLAKPLPPLQQEIIVVQSRGMERWLSMQLAHRFGICSNIAFPFPAAAMLQVFRAVLQDTPDILAFEPAALQWRIAALLPDLCREESIFSELNDYLNDDPQKVKLYQLAQRIAQTFDQYVVYRPDFIESWERGEGQGWQPALWQQLRQQNPLEHRAALRKRLIQRLQQTDFDKQALPPRLSVFGISALPPFYTDIADHLSKHIDVSLYIMNPCEAYWGDIVSDTEIAHRTTPKPGKQYLSAEEQYLERGNPLLASMGKLGRDFLDSLNGYAPDEYPSFIPAAGDNILQRLQNDILNLHDNSVDDEPAYVLEEEDYSLQIHNCHSPMREIEVLHDRLLALFAAEPDLAPDDVLVMTPDIEAYAPLIQAVFDTTGETLRIPFSIADRSARMENSLIDSFLSLLALPESRFTLPEVFDILHSPVIQEKFGLNPMELEQLQTWLQEAGVRWGIDAGERGQLDLPEFSENTWDFGLQRLLLGYAMDGRHAALFGEVLPFAGIEGGRSLILGKFLEFSGRVFETCKRLREWRKLPDWQRCLEQLINDFFQPEQEDIERSSASPMELQNLRSALQDLLKYQKISGLEEKVSLPVIRAWLNHHLEEEHAPGGFITGRTTFCAMLPMRSIPFKVICLIGLHDGAYPRSYKAPGFDLIAAKPRRGDRSRRNDDRYLFLESLLSARWCFYLSYAGQSIQDNSERPPSVLISELLDYIRQSFRLESGKAVIEHLVNKHPLQAFSPRYFDMRDPRLFSYAEEYCQVGEVLSHDRRQNTAFMTTPLPPEENEWHYLELRTLMRFFANPARFLLHERLKIELDAYHDPAEEAEAFSLSGLERYGLNRYVLEHLLSGEAEKDDIYAMIKASGELPPGEVGAAFYAVLHANMRYFSQQLHPWLGQNTAPPARLQGEINLGGIHVYGHTNQPAGTALLRYRPAKAKPNDLLGTWVQHLFFNATNTPCDSVYFGTDKGFRFRPPADSTKLLSGLLHFYRSGVNQPVLFFPQTSYVYLTALRKKNNRGAALKDAEKEWLGQNSKMPGESANIYYSQCFSGQDIFGKDFEETAENVYGPMLTYMEELTGNEKEA